VGGSLLDLKAVATPADFEIDDEGPRPSTETLAIELWQMIEQPAFGAER
jgi:hypothetical protein